MKKLFVAQNFCDLPADNVVGKIEMLVVSTFNELIVDTTLSVVKIMFELVVFSGVVV